MTEDTVAHDAVANEYGEFYHNTSLGDLYLEVTLRRMCTHIKERLGSEDLYVLDIGCGTCSILTELADRIGIKQATGIDVSEQMIEQARSRLSESNIDQWSLEIADFTNHDLTTSKYDVVLLQGGSLNYIGDPELVLTKVGQMKTDDGLAFLSVMTMYAYALFDLQARGFEQFEQTVSEGKTVDTNGISVRIYNLSKLETLIANHEKLNILDVYPKISYVNHLTPDKQQKVLDKHRDTVLQLELANAGSPKNRHGLQTEVVLQ